jgi:ribose transport system substrate-binding protein
MKSDNAVRIFVLLFAALLSAGCSKERSSGPHRIRVEFSFGAEDIDLYHAMEKSLRKAIASSKQDVAVSFTYALTSTEKQISYIRDSIKKKPDILVIMPQDSKAVLPLIGEAHRAGIRVIVYNRETDPAGDPDCRPDLYVGLDTADQAYTASIALFTRMKEAKMAAKVINVMGYLGDRNALNRNEGLRRAAAEMGARIVAEVPTDWTPLQAESGLDAALQAHPEANAIFCASDCLMDGIEQSLRKHDRWKPSGDPRHLPLASQDVFPNGARLLRSGYIDVDTAFDIWPMTTMLMQAILTIGNGRAMSQSVFLVPGRVVTAANIDKMDDLWSATLEN